MLIARRKVIWINRKKVFVWNTFPKYIQIQRHCIIFRHLNLDIEIGRPEATQRDVGYEIRDLASRQA